jgi:hypothetical protein
MNTTLNALPLRVLDRSLRLTRLVLAVVTPIAALLIIPSVLGEITVSLSGTRDAMEIEQVGSVDDQMGLPSGDGQLSADANFRSDDGTVWFTETKVRIEIGEDAAVVRAVAGAMVTIWLALAWIGAGNMLGISSSLRAGERFSTANVRRVRRIGVVVLAYPPVTFIGQSMLRYLVDGLELAGPPVSVDVGVADWWAWVLFGLLFLAIAELFSQGVALQELEEATI